MEASMLGNDGGGGDIRKGSGKEHLFTITRNLTPYVRGELQSAILD